MKITEEDYQENRKESRKIHIPRETVKDWIKFAALMIVAVAFRLFTIHYF